MPIPISNPLFQTVLFSIVFVFILIASVRQNRSNIFFPPSLTRELKGFAILLVLFAHIGYEIFNGSNFLFPLSTLGGVGVDLFLFLSGYGLTASSMNHRNSMQQLYQKRLIRLYAPLWIMLAAFLVMDAFFLHITYPISEAVSAFFGFFPQANAHVNINAPLWYFTAIIFYYLLFPVLFLKRHPVFSAVGIYLTTVMVLRLPLPIAQDTISLYEVHSTAFPIGMLLASIVAQNDQRFKNFFERFKKNVWINGFLLAVLGFGIWYTAIFSGVGQGLGKEQFLAMMTTLFILLFFCLKKFEFSFLSLLGVFSYEIYLIHWPIISRYDFMLPYIPAWCAVILYLGVLLGLAYTLQKIVAEVLKKFGLIQEE